MAMRFVTVDRRVYPGGGPTDGFNRGRPEDVSVEATRASLGRVGIGGNHAAALGSCDQDRSRLAPFLRPSPCASDVEGLL